MEKSSPIARFTTIVFLMVMLLPLAASTLSLSSQDAKAEDMAFPKLSRANLFRFTTQVEEWYKENFGARNSFIDSYDWIMLRFFKAEYLHNVILGKDKAVFGKVYVDQFRHLAPWSEEELKTAADKLEDYYKRCNASGTRFVFAVAPGKTDVLASSLPEGIYPLNTPSAAHRLKEFMASHGYSCPVAILRDTFKTITESDGLYYNYDTHWNYDGAHRGLKYLLGHVENNPLPGVKEKSHYKWKQRDEMVDLIKSSNLLMKLRGKGTTPEDTAWPMSKATWEFDYPVPKSFHFPPDWYIDAYKGPNTSSGSIMLFRDSFAWHYRPFLASSFSESIIVWDYQLDFNLIAQKKPQVVVLQIVDTNLKTGILSGSSIIR